MTPGKSLTRREQNVLRLLCDGCTYDEIAARLDLSTSGVRFHLRRLYGRLDANGRLQAIQAGSN